MPARRTHSASCTLKADSSTKASQNRARPRRAASGISCSHRRGRWRLHVRGGEIPLHDIVNDRRARTLFPARRSMPLTTSRDRVSEAFPLVINDIWMSENVLRISKFAEEAELRYRRGTPYPLGEFLCADANSQHFRSAYSPYLEIIPIVFSHVSTNCGHCVMGSCVRRSPKACPPFAYKCISTGTPAFFRAM